MHRETVVLVAVVAGRFVVLQVGVVASVSRVAVGGGDVRRRVRVAGPRRDGLSPHAGRRRPRAAGIRAGQLEAKAVAAFGDATRAYTGLGALAEGLALFFRVLERVGTRTGEGRSIHEARGCRRVVVTGLIRVTYASCAAQIATLCLALCLAEARPKHAVDSVAAPAVANARAGASDNSVPLRVILGSCRAERER